MSANRPLTLDNVKVCNTYELFLEVTGVTNTGFYSCCLGFDSLPPRNPPLSQVNAFH